MLYWSRWDIRDGTSVKNGIQAIISQAKRIDVLVNSAGVTLLGSTEETSIAEAQSLFDTNVFGILRTIQAVLPHMREQGSGRIINISSVLGFLPAPYMGLYSASKHAVEGMSETLDHEVRKFEIRVALVEPSFTKTSLDINAPHAASKLSAYDDERDNVFRAIEKNVKGAPEPDGVANAIVDAALGAWRMRRTPKGQAYLLSKLRRIMPAGPVDASLRKSSPEIDPGFHFMAITQRALFCGIWCTQLSEAERSMEDDQKSLVWISHQSDAKQRMREGGGAPGLARMEQIASKSGQEILDAMMSGQLPYPPMNETMNMTLLEVDNGRAVFQGIPLLQHYNPLGTVHGGWFASLLDGPDGRSNSPTCGHLKLPHLKGRWK
ncbi:hypothetical protein CS8_009740 [Cupriavidus sp. 8B]